MHAIAPHTLASLGLLDWATVKFGYQEQLLTQAQIADIATQRLQSQSDPSPHLAALCMCSLDGREETLQDLGALVDPATKLPDDILLARWRLADLLEIATDHRLSSDSRWDAIVHHFHAFNYPDLPCASVPHPEHLTDHEEFMRALTADIFLLASKVSTVEQVHRYIFSTAVATYR